MILPILTSLFERDLDKLKGEIAAYTHPDKLWYIEKQILNSAGNLCLHLIGNLNTYIGAQLGNTGYIRNREQEFSKKDLPKQELLDMIDQTRLMVTTTLASISEAHLHEEFPILVFKDKTSKGFMLMHLTTHLNWHLGQINYHRRLLDQ